MWRLGENIDPCYLQMVILSHIAFACFSFLFNNVVEKVWTKKMPAIGKENIRQILVGNLHNANLPINLSAKESDWESFVKRLFDRNTPYQRSQNKLQLSDFNK